MHVDNHHRAGDLVLGRAARDGLVADGARLIRARPPDDVVIGQGPERAVKESLADAGEDILTCLASGGFRGRAPPGKALLPLLRGRSVKILGSVGKNKCSPCPVPEARAPQ